MRKSELRRILYDALHSPRGIVLKTNDAEQLKRRLNYVRRQASLEGIREFENLVFRTSPKAPQSEVFIIPKGATASAERTVDRTADEDND